MAHAPKKEKADLAAIKAFRALQKELRGQYAAAFPTMTPTDQWEKKWKVVAELNSAYDKLSPASQHHMHYRGKAAPTLSGKGINESAQLAKQYKKEVAKGVRGKDLIQPFRPDGKLNPDFFEHHGDKAFEKYPEQKRRIKDELG